MLSLKYALKVMQFLHQDLPPMPQDNYTPLTDEQMVALVGRVIVQWPDSGYPYIDAYGRQKTKPDDYMLVLACTLANPAFNPWLANVTVVNTLSERLQQIHRDKLLQRYRVVDGDVFSRCGNPPA